MLMHQYNETLLGRSVIFTLFLQITPSTYNGWGIELLMPETLTAREAD